MFDKLCCPFAAGVLAVVLALSPNGVAAAPRHHHRRAVVVVHPRHYAYGRPIYEAARRPPQYGYVAPSEVPRVMNGYVYLPGHGIVGSPCDMPDSACTNDYRTVR